MAGGLTGDHSRDMREAVKSGNFPLPQQVPQLDTAEMDILTDLARRMSRRRRSVGLEQLLAGVFGNR